jgi:DNA-binding MarR family transcriptional regulator
VAEDDVLGVIEVASAVLVRNFELLRRRASAGSELDRSEYLLLRTLEAIGSADICGLAAALGLDPSTVGRQVAVMAGKGLVERSPAPADRRRSVVSPTPVGLAAVDGARVERRSATADLLEGWSEADLRSLAVMFTKYNRAVAEHYLISPDQAPVVAVEALLPPR